MILHVVTEICEPRNVSHWVPPNQVFDAPDHLVEYTGCGASAAGMGPVWLEDDLRAVTCLECRENLAVWYLRHDRD